MQFQVTSYYLLHHRFGRKQEQILTKACVTKQAKEIQLDLVANHARHRFDDAQESGGNGEQRGMELSRFLKLIREFLHFIRLERWLHKQEIENKLAPVIDHTKSDENDEIEEISILQTTFQMNRNWCDALVVIKLVNQPREAKRILQSLVGALA